MLSVRSLFTEYANERGGAVKYIEAFEVSEYGAPLDAAARARLFPFLPAAAAPVPFARKEWVDLPEADRTEGSPHEK